MNFSRLVLALLLSMVGSLLVREVARYSRWPAQRLQPRGSEISLSAIAKEVGVDIRAKEQEVDWLRIKLRPPAALVGIPSETALRRSDLGLYRPSNEATPVNAPTASSFQVRRPYRRVPEQRR
jgi:hypothetical protein